MRRLLALALAVGAMAWVRGATTGAADAALALGFALIGASVTGDALRRFNLPRVSGYLLFGLLVGPSLGNLITASMSDQLQVVTGLATTLIALIAGLTLSVERLGSRFAPIVRLTGATLAVAIVGLAAVGWLAWPWLPIAPDAIGAQRLVILALVVVIVVSFSPTMTAAVVADSGARGRLSDTVLAVVVLADLAILVLFSVSMLLARVVLATGEGGGTEILARLAWEIGGAVAFGVLIGVLFALYLRYIGREVTLVLLVVCAVLSRSARRSSSSRCWPPWRPASSSRTWRSRRATRCGRRCSAARRRCWWSSSWRSARPCASTLLRRLASPRWPCPSSASASSGSASPPASSRLGFRNASASTPGRGWCRRPGLRSGLPRWSLRNSPGGAPSCSFCSWPRLRFTSSSGRSCSGAAWPAPASSMRTRPALWSSCPTASPTSTASQTTAGS